jgi:hypothetical protein
MGWTGRDRKNNRPLIIQANQILCVLARIDANSAGDYRVRK